MSQLDTTCANLAFLFLLFLARTYSARATILRVTILAKFYSICAYLLIALVAEEIIVAVFTFTFPTKVWLTIIAKPLVTLTTFT